VESALDTHDTINYSTTEINMLTSYHTTVQDIEEPTLGGIEHLNTLHKLANVLDGTRQYMKLLLNEIPASNPLKIDAVRIYAENVQAGLDRIEDVLRTGAIY
jgi:hypothetical protein